MQALELIASKFFVEITAAIYMEHQARLGFCRMGTRKIIGFK